MLSVKMTRAVMAGSFVVLCVLGTASSAFASPHGLYSSSTKYCALCHDPHLAGLQDTLMKDTGAAAPGELPVCLSCHDGTSATDVQGAPANSFSLASGHTLEDTSTPTSLTNRCSSCHSPHSSETTNPLLPKRSINGESVSGANSSWCIACHDDKNSWYTAGSYPSLAAPSRDASGYPVLGTYPGGTVYQDATWNGHALIATATPVYPAGDCRYCHAAHRGPNKYDGLIAEFRPSTAATVDEDRTQGTYAELCFTCHGGNADWEAAGAVDIRQFVITEGANDAAHSGHRIKSLGADLPVNAPLPCYDCHQPHGSDAATANAALITPELGRSLDTTDASGVRHFCFTCHSTSDSATGWDAESASYVPVTGLDVEGVPRDGGYLKLPVVTGHREADAQSCYNCHGRDYSGPSSLNVHNPGSGVSNGGVDCYMCHATYQDYMEDGSGTAVGSQRLTVYHHVLGGPLGDGDRAFSMGSYPTAADGTDQVFCLSCHVDHDQFNASKSGNLRDGLTASPAPSNTDYSASGTYGICVSCHATSMAKDTANQLNDLSTATPKIVGGAGTDGFGLSAHNYSATSMYGDLTTFNANCSKCHNDEQTKDFQVSGNKFGTHWSAYRRLLSAFAWTMPSDPLQQNHCYGCHSLSGDGLKTASGRDYYNATDMTTSGTEYVYRQFQQTSTHPVVADAGGSVECESCHNVHVTTSTSRVTDPDNTYNSLAYGTVPERAAYCLRCHDGALPSRTVNGTTYIPYSVTQTDLNINNKNTNSARGHWSTVGAISASERVSCAQCHDNHGSDYPKLLGPFDPGTSSNKINAQGLTGNDNSVCAACHTGASTGYPTFTRLTNGYPNVGTWPTMATYTNTTFGIHRALQGGVAGTTLPNYSAGDCKTCHDVHGTGNTYDELRSTFSTTRFDLCFECHDSTGPAGANIAQWYPAASGGTASNTSARYGHKTVEAGTLPAGSALPCYDCHNPHGSAVQDGLMVVTQTGPGVTIVVGDGAGELNLSTAAGVRHFCFTCHIPSSTNNGWNGSAYSAVSAGAQIEGLDRLTQLKLSGRNPHWETNAQSCYSCHRNAHYPN